MTASFLDDVSEHYNLMLVVRYDEAAADKCAALRGMGLLYSVWYQYGREDTETIISGDLFCSAQQLSPIFTVLFSKPGCPDVTQFLVHQAVQRDRKGQKYPTILWELRGDNSLVDAIIFDDTCSVHFDVDGDLYNWGECVKSTHHNLFQSDLLDIFVSVYPKE